LKLNKEKFSEKRLRFFTGIMTSDGMGYFERNVARLKLFAVVLDNTHSRRAFCASNIFNAKFYKRLGLVNSDVDTRGKLLQGFWRKVLITPNLIRDVSFTPRYQLLKGAMDELEISKQIGLEIDFPSEKLIARETLLKLQISADLIYFENLGIWNDSVTKPQSL
jgi:hypothetical protein